MSRRPLPAVASRIKRIVDVAIAATGLAVLSPVIAATALAVRATMGRPVMFRQLRPGLYGRPFELVKFRTMHDGRAGDGTILPDGARLTATGRFLRATSLDELPQLWNVLRGDMSLVGPRPLLMRYLPRYSEKQARRHDVVPGLTGWAQVHGRNQLSWEEKFALDVWYVDHWSLALDARILALTLLRVLQRHGVSSSEENETMPEFLGSAGNQR